MKNKIIYSSLLISFLTFSAMQGQSIASSLGLYVFPANNQDAATQEADEMACFTWAKNQSGYDPLNPTQVTGAQVDRSVDGTAVVGAGVGAAGKVVGDERQQQANNQAAAAKEKELANNYNKAFSACMEGKGYTVK